MLELKRFELGAAMELTLEERVARLEKIVAELQQRNLAKQEQDGPAWLEYISGRFANDPLFDKAVELGRKYRESQRPRVRKPKSKKKSFLPYMLSGRS